MANVWLLTERQKTIDTYLRCAANYYGHITPRAFLLLFNKHNEEKLLKAELMKYWNKLMRQYDRNYVLYDNAIISLRIEMNRIDEIIYYQEGKKFYIPPKDEFLKYIDDYYYEKNEYTESVRGFFIKDLKTNSFTAEALLSKLVWSIKTEEGTSACMALLSENGIEWESINQVDQFMGLYQNLTNNTKKWSNCGYSPLEMHESFYKK